MIAAMNELLLGPEQTLVHFFNVLANQLQREITTSYLFGHLLKSTIALFVVLNPIGTSSFYRYYTKYEKGRTKSVSKTAIITSGIVLVVFAIAGTGILRLFGITIFSFMEECFYSL